MKTSQAKENKNCLYCNKLVKASLEAEESWGVEADENGKEKGYYHLSCKFKGQEE